MTPERSNKLLELRIAKGWAMFRDPGAEAIQAALLAAEKRRVKQESMAKAQEARLVRVEKVKQESRRATKGLGSSRYYSRIEQTND